MRKALPLSDLTDIGIRCASVWKELTDARVFVTGASGFVGSWMVESGGPGVLAHRGRADGDIRELVIPDGVTHVIHCASAASGKENAEDPAGVCDMITNGTRRVVEECERVRVRRLLHISSGSVYEPNASGTYTESDARRKGPPCNNGAAFAIAKCVAEDIVLDGWTPAVIARGFAMLGPRLPGQFASSQFLADALAARPITVNAPGTIRAYLYASDMAAWLWTLLVLGSVHTAYNVGGWSGIRVGDLAHLIAGEVGGCAIEEGTHPGAPPFMPDVTRALALGCPQPIPFSEAVRRWVAWERGQ